MNTQKLLITTSVSVALVFAASNLALAQSSVRQGTPLQRPGGFQQQQPQRQVNQRQQTSQQSQQSPAYYNINLSESQKSQPSLGATLYNAGGGLGVRSVYTNGPAQRAGITSGDFITKVNGQPVRSVSALNTMVGRLSPGDSIRLTKKTRAGKETQLDCKLMTMGQILNASIVPEAGVYETAALKAEQMLRGMGQEVKNAESELAELKGRYVALQKRIADLRSKAGQEREKAKRMKAADEAKRLQRIETLRKQAEEAAAGG